MRVSKRRERFNELVRNIPEPGDIICTEHVKNKAHVNVYLDKDGYLHMWVCAKINRNADGWYLSGHKHKGLKCYFDRQSVLALRAGNRNRLDNIRVGQVRVLEVIGNGDTKYLRCEVEE